MSGPGAAGLQGEAVTGSPALCWAHWKVQLCPVSTAKRFRLLLPSGVGKLLMKSPDF